MSDIVERLREESATWDDPLLADAVDEIERLRASNKDLLHENESHCEKLKRLQAMGWMFSGFCE
jgi:hypothetical protein